MLITIPAVAVTPPPPELPRPSIVQPSAAAGGIRGGRRQLSDAYRLEGYAVVTGVLGPEDIAKVTTYLDVLVSALGLDPGTPLVAAPPGDRYLGAFAEAETIRGLAVAALGSAVACFGVTYLDKPPRRGLPASWHQDGGPWRERLGGAAALTVWVALTDAGPDSGGLAVVPGSHALAPQPLRPDDAPSLFGVGMDVGLVEADRAVSLEVAAGDAVVHHANLIHGSPPNQSARRRLAIAFRYHAVGAAKPTDRHGAASR